MAEKLYFEVRKKKFFLQKIEKLLLPKSFNFFLSSKKLRKYFGRNVILGAIICNSM